MDTRSGNRLAEALLEERHEGMISTDELNARLLLESDRRAYAATGNPLFAWSALAVLLRPSARPADQYREPLIAPDPVPSLPVWLAEYLSATARAVLAPLLELSPAAHRTAASLAWCRRELEATGEALHIWAGVLLLRPRAELPAWLAVALFRIGRDLSDHMAGRDMTGRPSASDPEKLSEWQAAERAPQAGAPELLEALGFPLAPATRARLSRSVAAFPRVHARMAAASDLPIAFRLRQVPPRVSALELLEAFGFPKQKGTNPFRLVRACLRANDAAFTYDAMRGAGEGYSAAIGAAAEKIGDWSNTNRHIRAARRLASDRPELGT